MASRISQGGNVFRLGNIVVELKQILRREGSRQTHLGKHCSEALTYN